MLALSRRVKAARALISSHTKGFTASDLRPPPRCPTGGKRRCWHNACINKETLASGGSCWSTQSHWPAGPRTKFWRIGSLAPDRSVAVKVSLTRSRPAFFALMEIERRRIEPPRTPRAPREYGDFPPRRHKGHDRMRVERCLPSKIRTYSFALIRRGSIHWEIRR